MGLKQYVCNLYKELQIGKDVKFQNGFFETDDPEIQAKIERSSGFENHIHFKDALEEMERIGLQRQEETAGERARERRRILDEIAADEKAESRRRAKEKAKAEEERKEEKKVAEAQRRAAEAKAEEEELTEKKGSKKKGDIL